VTQEEKDPRKEEKGGAKESKESASKASGSEATSTDAKQDAKKMPTKQKVIIGVLVVVLLAVIGVLIYLLLQKDDEPPEERPTTGGRGIVVTPENVDEIRDQLGQPPEDAYYTANMNAEWRFETWDTPSTNAFVVNDEENTRTVYFDVILDATGETVYSSPFLPVGARHDDFALDAPVGAGDHSATVTYYLVDDDHNELTTVSVMVLLKIAK